MRMFALKLDSSIASYSIVPEDRLIIMLSNGFELVLFDHHVGYECFVIRAQDGGVVVV
jgi:hypothetical protein